MTNPATKALLDAIESRLANITSANGYSHNIGKIARARLTPFDGYDLPAVNFWCTSLAVVNRDYRIENKELQLYVECHDLTRDNPFIDVCDNLASDIVTALNRATAAPKVSDTESADLGGLVTDFEFADYSYSIGEGQSPFCGVLIRFNVRFTTLKNNMYVRL